MFTEESVSVDNRQTEVQSEEKTGKVGEIGVKSGVEEVSALWTGCDLFVGALRFVPS